ncbi:hypothetical protein BHM03_00042271 [Ensete ventricosum]|nr:hypothetical protein BHM03_00042271 [Ensete ventricosum]
MQARYPWQSTSSWSPYPDTILWRMRSLAVTINDPPRQDKEHHNPSLASCHQPLSYKGQAGASMFYLNSYEFYKTLSIYYIDLSIGDIRSGHIPHVDRFHREPTTPREFTYHLNFLLEVGPLDGSTPLGSNQAMLTP